MTVRVYYSSDVSAPTLSGAAGSLISVLDACLVNGYGAKASSGWAKEFSGTNKAVYRASTGTRFRLRVDDTSTQHAYLRAYEAMTTVDAGTLPYPTVAQQAGNGLTIRKSSTTDSNARGWVVVATEKSFYFLPCDNNLDWLTANSYSTVNGQFFFGDFTSLLAGDIYNSALIAPNTTGTSAGMLGRAQTNTSYAGMTGHFMARDYLASGGGSFNFSKRVLLDLTQSTVIGGYSQYGPFPDVVTGKMQMSPIAIVETAVSSLNVLRGFMPGFWAPLHQTPANNGDTVNGSGNLAGKTFLLAQSGYGTSNGRIAIEISDTW